MRRHYELPFGAEPVAGGVRFRLWAPRARAVSLQLEGHSSSQLMQPGPGSWFSLVTDRAQPGSRYKYLVDDNAYPDPASRFQPDGVHGASEVVDPKAYDWHDGDWQGRPRDELVIYELHLGA